MERGQGNSDPYFTCKDRERLRNHPIRPAQRHLVDANQLSLTEELRKWQLLRRGDVVFPSKLNAEKPFDRNSWRTKVFALAAKRAGFEGPTPHHLRHTFRSLLRLVGADHTLAKELLRHSSDAMSHYYSHTYEGETRAAVGRIDALVRLGS